MPQCQNWQMTRRMLLVRRPGDFVSAGPDMSGPYIAVIVGQGTPRLLLASVSKSQGHVTSADGEGRRRQYQPAPGRLRIPVTNCFTEDDLSAGSIRSNSSGSRMAIGVGLNRKRTAPLRNY